MNLLLDTHVFLRLAGADGKVSVAAADACGDPENALFLSYASIWEMRIKADLGKLKLDAPLAEIVAVQEAENSLQLLPIGLPHIHGLANLPHHHGDPFDRLILSTALVEGLAVVSADKEFPAYPVELIW